MATDTVVPVRGVSNRQIGTARISEDGTIVNIEMDETLFPVIMTRAIQDGFAQGLKLSIDYTPAVPENNKENDNGKA